MSRSQPDIASIAAALGEPARAAMCLALMDDRARPASELARSAHISAQTASSHLAKLTAIGIVRVERQGRWRYYRLSNEDVAHVVEALAVIAPAGGAAELGQPGLEPTGLYAARTCYRHLAGKLGVVLADGLLRNHWLAEERGNYRITSEGAALLESLDIHLADLRRQSRTVARRCLDWSERRPHVAGPLGAALADLALARDWIRRQRGTRAVLLTPFGRSEFQRVFRLRL